LNAARWQKRPKTGKNSYPGTFSPLNLTDTKVPGGKGGQPNASWDPEGHWDVDDGLGNRQRYNPDGTIVTAPEAHHDRPRTEQVPNDNQRRSTDSNTGVPTIKPGNVIIGIVLGLLFWWCPLLN
jgi:hypothetical protein